MSFSENFNFPQNWVLNPCRSRTSTTGIVSKDRILSLQGINQSTNDQSSNKTGTGGDLRGGWKNSYSKQDVESCPQSDIARINEYAYNPAFDLAAIPQEKILHQMTRVEPPFLSTPPGIVITSVLMVFSVNFASKVIWQWLNKKWGKSQKSKEGLNVNNPLEQVEKNIFETGLAGSDSYNILQIVVAFHNNQISKGTAVFLLEECHKINSEKAATILQPPSSGQEIPI